MWQEINSAWESISGAKLIGSKYAQDEFMRALKENWRENRRRANCNGCKKSCEGDGRGVRGGGGGWRKAWERKGPFLAGKDRDTHFSGGDMLGEDDELPILEFSSEAERSEFMLTYEDDGSAFQTWGREGGSSEELHYSRKRQAAREGVCVRERGLASKRERERDRERERERERER